MGHVLRIVYSGCNATSAGVAKGIAPADTGAWVVGGCRCLPADRPVGRGPWYERTCSRSLAGIGGRHQRSGGRPEGCGGSGITRSSHSRDAGLISMTNTQTTNTQTTTTRESNPIARRMTIRTGQTMRFTQSAFTSGRSAPSRRAQRCPPHAWDCPVLTKLDPSAVAWTCSGCGAIANTPVGAPRPHA